MNTQEANWGPVPHQGEASFAVVLLARRLVGGDMPSLTPSDVWPLLDRPQSRPGPRGQFAVAG